MVCQAEYTHPGLSYEFVMGLVRKGDLSLNINESILRLQVLVIVQSGRRNRFCTNVEILLLLLLFFSSCAAFLTSHPIKIAILLMATCSLVRVFILKISWGSVHIISVSLLGARFYFFGSLLAG